MIHNIFKTLSCVMVAFMATVTSFAATASDYEDIVYAKTVKASVGGTVELPIYLKNPSYTVKSFSFTIVLPDGITFDGYKTTKMDNYSDWSLDFATVKGQSTNTALAQMYYTKDATTSIASGDVELFTISLKIDENATAGVKAITIKNVMLAQDANNEHKILQGDEYISSNVNVQRAEIVEKQSDDYSLSVSPLSVETDATTAYVPVNMVNKNEVAYISFDVEYPEGVTPSKSGRAFAKPTINTERLTNGGEITPLTAKAPSKNSDGTFHYELNNDDVDTYAANGSGLAMTLPVALSSTPDGSYTVKLKNINIQSTTDYEAFTSHEGEYYFTFIVGTSTDKDPVIYGDITDASTIVAAIPTGATSVDISQATVKDEVVEAILENAQSKNVNAIVYAPGSYEGTKDNVVVSDAEGNLTCNSFKMTDGSSMNIPASFAASSASYSRNMTSNWGTICLPYAVSSNADVAYYNIASVADGVLTLERYDDLPANTPALVKKLSGNAFTSTNENVVVGGELSNVTGEATMIGTYTKDTKVTDTNAYYIKSNAFWRCNNSFYVNAFRAYFTVSQTVAAKNASFSISEGAATALNALVGETDVRINEIYRTDGTRSSSLQNGMNIVRLSNGKIQKILIK